jgi:hypothetical protein
MSFFKDIVTDINKVEEKFLGPDYPYYKKIATPGKLGVSGEGSIKALDNDIAAIVSYVEVLVSGSGAGNIPGKPLGNKFFLETGGQCKDYKTNKNVTRSMYINNVPTGDIPIVSNLSGMKFPGLKGLVPGIMSDMYAINPLKMFSAFMEGSEPLCAEVNLPVRNVDDVESTQSGYIPISELKDMAGDGIIPEKTVTEVMTRSLDKNVSGSTTKEGFINLCETIFDYGCKNKETKYNLANSKNTRNTKPQEIIQEIRKNINKLKTNNKITDKLFYTIFSLLLLYFSLRLLQKWQ